MADKDRVSAEETAEAAAIEDKAAKSGKDKAGKATEGKDAKKKGPGVGKKIAKYFRDSKGEFKKVVWPTFSTVVRNTGVTLAMCAVLGLFICVFDFGLSWLIDLMLSLG